MLRSIFLVLTVLASFSAVAQDYFSDKKLTVEACLEQAKHYQETGDLKEATRYLNTAAMQVWEERKYNEAISFFQQSIDLNQQLKNESGIAKLHSNLAMIYSDMFEFEKSLEYFQLALEYRLKYGERNEIISTHINKAVVQNNLKRYNDATKSLEEALLLATEIADESQMKSCYGMLSETYEKAGNHKKAIEYFHLYKTFHEREQRERVKSVQRDAEQAKLNALQLELEKKEQELMLLDASRDLKEAETELEHVSSDFRALYDSSSKRDIFIQMLQRELELDEAKIAEVETKNQTQKLVTGISVLGFILMSFSGILLFRNYRYKKKTNEKLNAQNESIKQLNESLEEKVEKRTAELRQTLHRLEKRNRELDQFSHVISHNLRGPVARILGLGKLINREQPADPLNLEVFDRTVQATNNLDSVVKDLSIILQAHDNQTMPRETVALAPLLESTKELLKSELETTKATITFTCKNSLTVTVVKPYIESIFYNLLSNAIKYHSPDRLLQIQIAAKVEEGKFFLSIADNGNGIEEENLEKIFEPYKRLTIDGDGKGLGLYLVRTHVEAMGGIISVTSTLNKGTTFTIEIPQH
ncbi:MAG: tetratricopeptide repeat protein [Cytophagales bacterium]|nr:tetratricopeptide repeat protein [Cytophagales bacterium]